MKLKKIAFGTICTILMISFFILMISSAANISLLTSENYVSSACVVIDAGHGGEDGGAVNDDGVLEKNINLEIAKDASELLKFLGYKVIMTRTEDTALSGDEATIHARKVEDMKKRLEIYNSDKIDAVISIHQNKYTEKKYYGTQIFYSPNNEKSKVLADNIKSTVKKLLQPDNERECKSADSGIYLLKNAKNPAIIVECGFISNPEECSKLLNDEYQKQIAFSITFGFIDYYFKEGKL